jgi:hypothetical protein
MTKKFAVCANMIDVNLSAAVGCLAHGSRDRSQVRRVLVVSRKDPFYLHARDVVIPGETIWASGDSRNVWIRYVAPR